MVTNWTVAPAGPGSSVTVKTSWQGAGGIGGFFEKTFAPLGLSKIQAEVLDNLKKQVESRLAGPRLLGAQEARDTADDGVGVLLPALGRLHQRRVGGVLHVAQLDQDRRVLRQVQPGEVGARVEAARSRCRWTARMPEACSWSRMICANCTDGPACAWLSGGDE